MKKVLLCSLGILLLIFISVDAQAYLFQQLPGSEPMAYTSNASEDFGISRTADDFILPSASPINGITWWGFDEGGGWSGRTSDFTFTFYADNNGSPGSPLPTTSGSTYFSGSTSGGFDNSYGVYVYTSVLNESFNAEAGTTYWLSIFDNNTGSTWGWMMSDGGQSLQEFNGDGTWNPMYSNAAFELSYNAVPIPSAAWLLASGLIGLVVIRRRLKK